MHIFIDTITVCITVLNSKSWNFSNNKIKYEWHKVISIERPVKCGRLICQCQTSLQSTNHSKYTIQICFTPLSKLSKTTKNIYSFDEQKEWFFIGYFFDIHTFYSIKQSINRNVFDWNDSKKRILFNKMNLIFNW